MRRKKEPLDLVDVKDQEAKAKVALVLEVLSGEKSIAQACRDKGIAPILYYKLEERLVRAMVVSASMPPSRGRRKDPLTEARTLVSETEELRLEHRRMQSLVRVSKKLFRSGRKPRGKRGPGRPPKAASPETPAAT